MTRMRFPSSTAKRQTGGIGRWFAALLVLIVAGGALWTWLTLAWAYAEGERAGVLQKFVRRGWICKTREGEIALYYGGGQYLGAGTTPQLWDFSVRDPTVAEQLTKAVGHRVQLHYTEHPGIPTNCFADTRYIVDSVIVADIEPPSSPGTAPAAAPVAPSPAIDGPPASAAPAAPPGR